MIVEIKSCVCRFIKKNNIKILKLIWRVIIKIAQILIKKNINIRNTLKYLYTGSPRFMTEICCYINKVHEMISQSIKEKTTPYHMN